MPFIEINLNYFLFPEPTFESDNNSPIVRNCDISIMPFARFDKCAGRYFI